MGCSRVACCYCDILWQAGHAQWQSGVCLAANRALSEFWHLDNTGLCALEANLDMTHADFAARSTAALRYVLGAELQDAEFRTAWDSVAAGDIVFASDIKTGLHVMHKIAEACESPLRFWRCNKPHQSKFSYLSTLAAPPSFSMSGTSLH